MVCLCRRMTSDDVLRKKTLDVLAEHTPHPAAHPTEAVSLCHCHVALEDSLCVGEAMREVFKPPTPHPFFCCERC